MGVAVGYSRRALRFDKIELLLGAKGRFPNGCGRLALCAWKEKAWRAGIVAVLKDWQVICLAAGSMIMLGIMLYSDWPQ
jgi:hypothetical protein